MTFEELWNEVSAWAEQQSGYIAQHGIALLPAEMEVARRLGVRAPEKVRVLLVDHVPFPESAELLKIGEQVGLVSEKTGGLTLGHTIFIRNDQKSRRDLLLHELRHVAQAEALGSIRNATFVYLKELLHFGYGQGPMEIDAKVAEHVERTPNGPGAAIRSNTATPA